MSSLPQYRRCYVHFVSMPENNKMQISIYIFFSNINPFIDENSEGS